MGEQITLREDRLTFGAVVEAFPFVTRPEIGDILLRKSLEAGCGRSGDKLAFISFTRRRHHPHLEREARWPCTGAVVANALEITPQLLVNGGRVPSDLQRRVSVEHNHIEH